MLAFIRRCGKFVARLVPSHEQEEGLDAKTVVAAFHEIREIRTRVRGRVKVRELAE